MFTLSQIMKKIILLCSLCAAILFLQGPAFGLGMPSVDRGDAERLFFMAYSDFMSGRYWHCITNLDEAIKKNTFYVDTYLLRALALRRMGRPGSASVALGHYLEVRRFDERVTMIKSSMESEASAIASLLKQVSPDVYIAMKSRKMAELFPVPLWSPFSWRSAAGIGKIASVGNRVYVPDQLGGALYSIDGSSGKVQSVVIPAPAAVIPLSPGRLLVACWSGDMTEVWHNPINDNLESKPLGRFSGTATDAALISQSSVVIADRLNHRLRFLRRSNFSEYAQWIPETPANAPLFEPVSVEMFGPYLAVADRGAGRIYLLDVFTLQERGRVDMPMVRDISWYSDGSLWALCEDGSLFLVPRASFTANIPPMSMGNGFKDAWSMCMKDGALLVADATARQWWDGVIGPVGTKTAGFLTLGSLMISSESGVKRVTMQGFPGSVYPERVAGEPMVDSVWQNSQLRTITSARKMERTPRGFVLSPVVASPGLDTIRSLSVDDLWKGVAEKDYPPDVFILDSAVQITDTEALRLLGYCIYNGVRVDVVLSGRPPSELLEKVRRYSGGFVYGLDTIENLPVVVRNVWDMSIPLPTNDTTGGYPSESMISVFGNVHNIWFRDWIPLWPSLVK